MRIMSTTIPAAEAAQGLARQLARATAMPFRPQDAELLVGAETFRFGPDASRVAWSIGEGPLILLVHGWGGRGTQMAGLARSLASAGHRCVFFDAGGHGDSRPEPVGFDTFVRDADHLTRHLAAPVFAWICHSAGGLGMMAARALHGVSAQRYVCISAPRFPYVPLETLRANTGAPDEVLNEVKPILAAQFQASWADLEAGHAYRPELGKPLLLAYDRDDERVRHADADAIAADWPGAQVLKTSGYGHNRILQSPEVWDAVHGFLRQPA